MWLNASKKVLSYCNIGFRALPCNWLLLRPLAKVLRRHRQLLINWNRGLVWPPNTVFTRNQERQWLQLLRKIAWSTPPLSLWKSDTDVEFPLFCRHWVEASAPVSLHPSYLPFSISNLTSPFRGPPVILKLNLSQPKINPQVFLCGLNSEVGSSSTSQIWGRMSRPQPSLGDQWGCSKGRHGSHERVSA